MPTEEFAGYFFIFEDDAKKTRTFGFGSDKDRILKRKAQGFQKDGEPLDIVDKTTKSAEEGKGEPSANDSKTLH